MKKLTIDDILPLPEYEKKREVLKRDILRVKEWRRVHLGDRITLLFENRETVRMQIQEMMRVEHIYDPEKIENEISVYNPLIPEENELSATLFIEIAEESNIRLRLDEMIGLDNGKSLYLKVGSGKVYAKFEEGHSEKNRISAVHYIRFNLAPEHREDFVRDTAELAVVIDHPNYQAVTRLTEKTRDALSADFR